MRSRRQLALERLEARDVPSGPSIAARDSLARSVSFLRREMDRYHSAIGVYEDVDSPANHFFARGKFPDADAPILMDEMWTDRPHGGATAIQCVFSPTPTRPFGGVFFMNGVLPAGETVPQPQFGTVRDAGYNLAGAATLTFWARGQTGRERISFFMGGIGRDANGVATAEFPDSAIRAPQAVTTTRLTKYWAKYTISVTGRDRSAVLAGFGWGAGAAENPSGAVFYLDDIRYNLGSAARARRLDEPRFVRSFVTRPVQPDITDPNTDDDLDRVLRNVAFSYDNALAVLAFLAHGSADSVRRARVIVDAFVYAATHDRYFDEGRVRTAYRAGDLALPDGWTPNNRPGTAATPGFTDDDDIFREVEQTATDTGNNAWVGIALLALYRKTGTPGYLPAATRIAEFVRQFRQATGTYRGFLGGINDPEGPGLGPRPYASTEHNLDLRALFTTLFQLTGTAKWQTDALHAEQFVEAMWDPARGAYLTGTTNPETRNEAVIPLDVQAWSGLAIPGAFTTHPNVLDTAILNHRTTADGVTGYDFNEDKDGVWFEGTAQMAVAFEKAGREVDAEAVRKGLRRAQQKAPFGDGSGIVAASHDGVTTGFNFKYFLRRHVRATAWLAVGQAEFNPFYDYLKV